MQLNINSIYTSRQDAFLNNHVSQLKRAINMQQKALY